MVIFFGPKLRNGIAGSYDTSVFSVSRKCHGVFHCGLTIYIPPRLGGFYFLYVLCSNYSLKIFSMMFIVTSVRWYLTGLFGIDLIITAVDYLSMCFYYYFTSCENNLPVQSGLFKVGPPLEFFFPMIYPRTFLEGRCHLQPSWTCDYYEPFSICFKVYILIRTS